MPQSDASVLATCRGKMKHKKRVITELVWFFSGIAGGTLIFIFLFDLLNIDINLPVLAAGGIVTLVAMYVVRLTLWVFKKNL